MTDEVRDAIVHGASLEDMHKVAAEQGMVTLRGDGMNKVRAGITTLEEVIRVSEDR